MASFDPSVKVVEAATGISIDTKANWEAFTQVLPAGLFLMESDTGYVKLTDGTHTYTELPYLFNAFTGIAGSGPEFTQAYKDMLDNANAANGVAQLGADGKLPDNILPDSLGAVLTGVVHYVATYDALPVAGAEGVSDTDLAGLFVVMDASGDPTVTAGSAGYVWHQPDTGDGSWIKIFEAESMDQDFSTILADYFNKSTDTLDDITDGTTYIKLEKEWKETVDDWMTHAIRDDDKIFIQNPNAAGYAAMMSPTA